MSEEPKSIWKRPWQGPAWFLGWYLTLNAATFVTVLCFGLLSEKGTTMDLVWSSLALSIGIALVATFAVWFAHWISCWRNFRKFLFGASCFVTLIALFYAVENWRGKHAWEKYRKELEAKGETVSIAELAPPAIPDEKNFALTPLLKPALDLTQSPRGTIWHDTNGIARLRGISPDPPAGNRDVKLVPGSVEKGTLADLAQWQAFYRGNTNYPQPAEPGTPAEDVLVALSKFDPEINELLEAAGNRPLCRFPVAYDYEPPFEILLPHLGYLRQLALLTHVRATAELDAGRSERAFRELMLGFRFSDAAKDEPILISHLVRMATLTTDLQVIREGLGRHAWTESQLVRLEKYLASTDLLAEYESAMRGERAFGVSAVDYMRRHGRVGESGVSDFELPPMIPSGWFYRNMLTMARMHEEFTLAGVNAANHRAHPDVAEKMSETTDQLRKGIHPYSFFAGMLIPALSKTMAKTARIQTFVDAAQVACALERYRLSEGSLPENLAALVPRFIESIPNDVIDGRPLRYQSTGSDSYVLYSVGWNESDDGGEVVWRDDDEKNVNLYEGDWVWWGGGNPDATR